MCDRCNGGIDRDDIKYVLGYISAYCKTCQPIIEAAEKERNDISYRRTKNARV